MHAGISIFNISVSDDILVNMQTIPQSSPETKLLKGLADTSRLHILEAIAGQSKTVGTIVAETGLSQPNVSMHLSCLFGCGLVNRRKNGRETYYIVSCSEVVMVLATVRKIIRNHEAEIASCDTY